MKALVDVVVLESVEVVAVDVVVVVDVVVAVGVVEVVSLAVQPVRSKISDKAITKASARQFLNFPIFSSELVYPLFYFLTEVKNPGAG